MNEPNINDMLQSVLSDPKALSGVMKLAQELMQGQDGNALGAMVKSDGEKTPPSPAPAPDSPGDAPSLPKLLAYDKNRTELLKALRPYLSESRRGKVDYILNILQILALAGNLK